MSQSAAVLTAGAVLLAGHFFRRSASTLTAGAGAAAASSSAKSAPKAGPGQHVNKFGDVEDTANLRVADWARRWEKTQTGWHKSTVHASLAQFQPSLASAAAAKAVREGTALASSAPTVLVPLCGKSVDLVWLLHQGYRVVGIEIVTQAIIDFFYEQAETLPSFTAEKIAGTSIYRYTAGPQGRLQILQADIYSPKLTREMLGVPNGFDFIWDRASLVALNPHQRATYAQLMDRLLAPRGQQLLNTFTYDQSLMHGPPFSVEPSAVAELYSDAAGYTRKVIAESTFALEGGGGPGEVKAVMRDWIIERKQ